MSSESQGRKRYIEAAQWVREKLGVCSQGGRVHRASEETVNSVWLE